MSGPQKCCGWRFFPHLKNTEVKMEGHLFQFEGRKYQTKIEINTKQHQVMVR